MSKQSPGSTALLLCSVLASALCLAGCGSSAPSGTNADPASLAPATSTLYLGATLRPQGTLRQDALADARKLSHSHEPFSALLQALTGSSPLGKVSYAREVQPWLGRSGGLFATSPTALGSAAQSIEQSLGSGFSPEALLRAGATGLIGAKGAGAALVLDTSDLSKARAFVAKLSHQQGASGVSYRGNSFDLDPRGYAEAIVGKFAVFGNEAGVKAVIDTHLGGAAMKSSAPYATLAGKGPGGALATAYLDPGAAGQTTGGRQAAAQAESVMQALPGEPKQVRISVLPQHGAVAIDADLLGSAAAEAKAAAAANNAAELVGNLPGGSWLALGAGEGGTHLASDLTLLDSLVSLESKSLLASFGGPELQALLGRLASHPQALQRLFANWAGPAAAFAAGSGLLNIEAGLTIESSSTQAARAAVGKLGALLSSAGAGVQHTSIPGTEAALTLRVSGLPLSLDVGAGGGRFVIGLGPESVQGAISPSSTFSSSSSYAAASSTLGGAKPSVLVEFPMALALLEGIGLNEDPSFAPTIADLRPLGSLAGNLQPLGNGALRLHLVLGLSG